MPSELRHKKLNATFVGVDEEACVQYRGIPYASVPERFAEPVLIGDWGGRSVDCRSWGPRCPQVKLDIGFLLRAPGGDVFYDDAEDEFGCLNLDVTVPAGVPGDAELPVLVWIHGGSQIVSFGNGASKVGDTRKIVQDSVQLSTPIIVVSVQYRLNIFHVGDCSGTKNLGFKDQQAALLWVRQHIGEFGGDPGNITLAGESAGAAFVHALLVSQAHVRRGVLMSGSMYMTPPQPAARAKAMLVDPILRKVKEKGYPSLREAPVQVLLDAQAEVPIRSVFMQEDECFADWQNQTGLVDEVIVGDCEFESVLWKEGVDAMTVEQLEECFDQGGASKEKLKALYHIDLTRAAQCKHGALDLLNDMAFARNVPIISETYRRHGKRVYRYVLDQANPWQASSRAHHAVDLVYLFGGFDLSINPSAARVGMEMRRRFVSYVSGEAPWSEQETFAFGPLGETKEIGDGDVAVRRRTRQMEELGRLEPDDVTAVFRSLAAGRISLHN